jgi:ribose transport system ATP-binding protein
MLELSKITKDFRGVRALAGVDFTLRAGEVHVLFGENGAGKSTLINIIAGMFPPSQGSMSLDGAAVERFDPHHARSLGIAAVFQEFSLVPSLSVLDNLFLGRERSRGAFLDRKAMRAHARRVLDELGYRIDVDVIVSALSRAQRQMIEIAKALLIDARVLILDEPTASLTDDEADHLLAIVKSLRARGVGIIYVSHRMREIHAIADRITVLRSGASIGTVDAGDISEARLVEMMTGRKIDAMFPKISHHPAEDALVVQNLISAAAGVDDISLTLRRGEVVGIAGLVGCGKGGVGRAIFGLDPCESGVVAIAGEVVKRPQPRAMLQRGLCYFPSDRGAEGLAPNLSIERNAIMAALDLPRFNRAGLARPRQEHAAALSATERLVVRPSGLSNAVQNLSGGNRQKVMLARGFVRDIEVFIFDEPTVGIDVGAKTEIYQLIADLVEQGAAILLISSELIEVLNLSNRLYVMHEGRLTAHFEGEDKTEANVLAAFFGHAQPVERAMS